MHHPSLPATRATLALLATVCAVLLTACGGGDLPDDWGQCPAPDADSSAPPELIVRPDRPDIYGTGAPWFIGPLQSAPADVSAAYGIPLIVCP